MRIERRARTFDGFREEVVERREDITALGVMAVLEFVVLRLMATRAIKRRDDGRDMVAVMVEAVDVAFLSLVALNAANPFAGVRAAFPVIDNPRRAVLVAFNALLGR